MNLHRSLKGIIGLCGLFFILVGTFGTLFIASNSEYAIWLIGTALSAFFGLVLMAIAFSD